MSNNIGKNINKNLSSIYSQKRLDHAKQSGTDELKTVLKRTLQKATKKTGDLTGNKICNKITKGSPQNFSEKFESET